MTQLLITDTEIFIQQDTPLSLLLEAEKASLTRRCRSCREDLPITDFYTLYNDTLTEHITCQSCRDKSEGTKTCSRCHQEQPLNAFSIRKGTTSRDSWCANCRSEYGKAKREKKREERNKLKPKKVVPEGSKVCCRCKCEKPLSEYYSDKNKPDGRGYACKACLNGR
jgi:hypothetical protein